ncbi:ABC transporter ATP-binding protein [Pedobacter endophyticus]|uniref:ABC transporter ATP-binding protein n=1 Tax=Pedobacter endophyticus TaxID=2789740 RepID=A0A7S9L294_9SPHI|nr:ABC transporter ATP-binding protein [Pedobacter endophyticus]QPH40811.1 ABC transporter ATP-binding protein [Pedobacter endophyticus]
MIKLEKVSKYFGETAAVKNISLNVAEKENMVLLGTSGCGKTTTLKMINRLIDKYTGEIFVDGKKTSQQNPEELRRGIGYVMQSIGLFPHYTVEENIAVVPKLLKWDKQRTAERTRELVAKLHLSESSLSMFPHELSGGQQQRVGLARALVADPPILLMDEPFGALDNVTRSSIQKEFKALEELQRKTILMVTHDVQEAFELAHRICLMDKGEIVQTGTPKDLLYNPVNAFARQFFDGQRLTLELMVVKLHDIWHQLKTPAHNPNLEEIDINTNIWDTLERLRLIGPQQLAVKNGDSVKEIDFGSVTEAFNKYQKP